MTGVREVVLKEKENDMGYYPPRANLAFLDDHVLLWDYTEPASQLSFHGPDGRHDRLLSDLWVKHRAVVGDWIPYSRYLNGYFVCKGLSGISGVLAYGPDRLLKEYASVFAGSEIEAYFPYPPRPVMRWDEEGSRYVEESRELSVLILGNSHIIGEHFEAERIDSARRELQT